MTTVSAIYRRLRARGDYPARYAISYARTIAAAEAALIEEDSETATMMVDGFTVTLTIEPDCDSTDLRDYSAEEIARYERGDWWYAGLIASVGGIEHVDSLWGIEWGLGDRDYELTTMYEVAQTAVYEYTHRNGLVPLPGI